MGIHRQTHRCTKRNNIMITKVITHSVVTATTLDGGTPKTFQIYIGKNKSTLKDLLCTVRARDAGGKKHLILVDKPSSNIEEYTSVVRTETSPPAKLWPTHRNFVDEVNFYPERGGGGTHEGESRLACEHRCRVHQWCVCVFVCMYYPTTSVLPQPTRLPCAMHIIHKITSCLQNIITNINKDIIIIQHTQLHA